MQLVISHSSYVKDLADDGNRTENYQKLTAIGALDLFEPDRPPV